MGWFGWDGMSKVRRRSCARHAASNICKWGTYRIIIYTINPSGLANRLGTSMDIVHIERINCICHMYRIQVTAHR